MYGPRGSLQKVTTTSGLEIDKWTTGINKISQYN